MRGKFMRSNKLIWVLEEDQECISTFKQVVDIRYNTKFFSSINELKAVLDVNEEVPPSLIIADINMSGGSFLDLLHESNNRLLKKVPFIIASDTNDLDVLRFCFQKGASDFLIKPLRSSELIAKIEQSLKRNIMNNFDLSRDFLSRESLAQKFNFLTPKESSILSLFMTSPDKKVSRSQIMSTIWDGISVQNKTVDVHLHNLRKKIHPLGMSIRSTGLGEWIFIENEPITEVIPPTEHIHHTQLNHSY